MLWTEQLFHIKKTIIAMLHPDALKMLYFINPESDRIRTHALCQRLPAPRSLRLTRTASASVSTPPVRMWMMR